MRRVAAPAAAGGPGAGTSDYTQLANKPALGTAASKNVGTAAGTVAAGDHAHAGVYATPADVDTRVQQIVGAAPATLDTLAEVAAQLASDESAAAALANAVAQKADATATANALAGKAATGHTHDVTALGVGSLADGEYLRRNGSGLVGGTPGGSAPLAYYAPAPGVGKWQMTAYTQAGSSQWDEGREASMPMRLVRAATVDALAVYVAGAGSAGAVVRLGIKARNASGRPGAVLVDGGTVGSVSAGWKTLLLTTPLVLSPGEYFITVVPQGAPVTRAALGTGGVGGQVLLDDPSHYAEASFTTYNQNGALSDTSGSLGAGSGGLLVAWRFSAVS